MHMWNRVRQRGCEIKSDPVCVCTCEKEKERERVRKAEDTDQCIFVLAASAIEGESKSKQIKSRRLQRGARRGWTASNQHLREHDYCLQRAGEVTVKPGAVFEYNLKYRFESSWRETPRCHHLPDNWIFSGYGKPSPATCREDLEFGSWDVSKGRFLCIKWMPIVLVFISFHHVTTN